MCKIEKKPINYKTILSVITTRKFNEVTKTASEA